MTRSRYPMQFCSELRFEGLRRSVGEITRSHRCGRIVPDSATLSPVGADVLCIKLVPIVLPCELIELHVHTAKIVEGDYQDRSLLLPFQEPEYRDATGYVINDSGDNYDNSFEDEALVQSARELMTFLKIHRLLSTTPHQTDRMLGSIVKVYRLTGIMGSLRSGPYSNTLLKLVKNKSLVAIGKAHLAAKQKFPGNDPGARLRREAEALRLLSARS
jgi:hypothetical protein